KPLFFQLRPGKNERIFKIIKFKTMNDKTDADGKLLPDSDRLTQTGRFVRKTSIDEIPQLINVLMGDMCLVGPRPLLPRYLPYYTETERIRHQVRPGITGLAQVKGRNILEWDKRLAYDVQYVNEISFKSDVLIILLTIKKVLKSDGVVVDPNLILLDLDEERKHTNSSI